jgi:hypothetical protein
VARMAAFDYLLTFSSPVNIQSITFNGDAFNGVTFALFDVTNRHLKHTAVLAGVSLCFSSIL